MSSKLRNLNARFLFALLLAITASACQLTDGIGPTFTPTHTAQPEDTSTPVPERPPIPSPTATLTPIPTATAAPEIEHPLLVDTFTPTPTETPEPVEVPSPTASATPTATATPSPSPSPMPTPTPSSTATATPEPTHTPTPTFTPEPTATPIPTSTPTPTSLEVSSALLEDSGICNTSGPPLSFVARPDFPEEDWTPPPWWRVVATATHNVVNLEWDVMENPVVTGYRVFRWQVDSDEIVVVDLDLTVTSFSDSDGIFAGKPSTDTGVFSDHIWNARQTFRPCRRGYTGILLAGTVESASRRWLAGIRGISVGPTQG